MNAAQRTELLEYFTHHFVGDYVLDEPLAPHTWYKIGGPVDVFAFPRGVDQVVTLLGECRKLDIPTFIIGEGANLLVSDEGYRGVVLNLGRYIRQLTIDEDMVHADAGVALEDLVMACEGWGRGGLEGLAGIPGTVGGALIMNAGTHNGEIGDRVQSVTMLNDALEPVVLAREDIHFAYRSAPELQSHVLVRCTLAVVEDSVAALQERRRQQLRERAAKQPLEYPSCGSVFKRPPGHYVGRMVEELGLRGLRRGGAMIPEKHGGFVVNLGGATANDVMYLIKIVQERVLAQYGVQLEPELRFVGFSPASVLRS